MSLTHKDLTDAAKKMMVYGSRSGKSFTTWDYLTDNSAWFMPPSATEIKMNIKPDTIVVPPALEEAARRVMYSHYHGVLEDSIEPDKPTLDEIIDKKIKALNEKRSPSLS